MGAALLAVAVALFAIWIRQASATPVSVEFEGPWAFVPDPQNERNILAIAPNTKSHRPLTVANSTLDAGVYELPIPARVGKFAANLDPGFYRTRVDPKNVERALEDKTKRYAIRLPRPDNYTAISRERSRVGSAPNSEQDYVIEVALKYKVASLNGLLLTGTPDSPGAFLPIPLGARSPIRFAIKPVDDVHDMCSMHSREAFRDLATLLGLGSDLSVQFPGVPADCPK